MRRRPFIGARRASSRLNVRRNGEQTPDRPRGASAWALHENGERPAARETRERHPFRRSRSPALIIAPAHHSARSLCPHRPDPRSRARSRIQTKPSPANLPLTFLLGFPLSYSRYFRGTRTRHPTPTS